VIAGLLAGLLLSPKLWMSTRLYPLTPVWALIPTFAPPIDRVVFFSLIALLALVGIAPRRVFVVAAFVLLTVLALQDQSRWQPWFYQYTVMLLAIVLAAQKRDSDALNTCGLIVAATYLWSGFAKLNPNFMRETFPFLLSPFVGALPAPVRWIALHSAYSVPFIECGLGIGLLYRRSRGAAVYLAIAMHVFILLAIGPLGSKFNSVVWPWNLAMIAFLLVIFLYRSDPPTPRDIVWGTGFAFQKVVLLLFGVMPVFNTVNLWDHYLSSALYSGNRDQGTVYVSDAVFDRLPDLIEDHVYESGPDRSALDISDWSLDELNVPSYPEIRIYKNVAAHICAYSPEGAGIELVIDGKLALLNGKNKLVYHCQDLPRIIKK